MYETDHHHHFRLFPGNFEVLGVQEERREEEGKGEEERRERGGEGRYWLLTFWMVKGRPTSGGSEVSLDGHLCS